MHEKVKRFICKIKHKTSLWGDDLKRAYYGDSVSGFLNQDENYILGELAKNNQFSLEDLQRNTWIEEIRILKQELCGLECGYLLFEYTIPRIGNRIDNVLIYRGLVFLLEFKVGEREYPRNAMDQVLDYALDLKYFHKESHKKKILPMLISTKAKEIRRLLNVSEDGIFDVLLCNENNIKDNIERVCKSYFAEPIEPKEWINSIYMPTPTIIEAAQALYRGHNVEEISRSDSGAMNLNCTTKAINKIIDESKWHNKKSICFITGVPGAGKTLAGLNIANERHKFDENEHAVFLSGNQPLVDVLQEALARDESVRTSATKGEAIKKAKAFIQIIHHFRDDAISVDTAPIEKVAIFDEAQRAWDEPSLVNFMTRKKGVPNFNMSEPEFLISIMDRHEDWAVIICLVGGGQEINTGEAGLQEWFDALKSKYPDWNVYVSDKLGDSEYVGKGTVENLVEGLNCSIIPELHLAVSLRSFRSEKVSEFVKTLLDVNIGKVSELYRILKNDYPIVMTRDLEKAKIWVKTHARGTERYGLTASSGAKRLRSFGVWVQSKAEAKNWFLNDKDDVRSSYFLEDTATEFDIQGLELDWTIVCWDANLRFENGTFNYYSFKGAKWQRVNSLTERGYLKNAYRVLLTRARQGFIIFIPNGNVEDYSRPNDYYDGTYNYLKTIGIKEI